MNNRSKNRKQAGILCKMLCRMRCRMLCTMLCAMLFACVGYFSQGTQAKSVLPELKDDPAPRTLEEEREGFTKIQTDSPVDAYTTDVPRPDFSTADVAPYAGEASITVHEGVPFLEGDEIEQVEIWLSPLDESGRCGSVMMLAGPETLPTAKRGSISYIRPTGWKQRYYTDLIHDSNGALYRRCHMLMFAFSGMNATAENLIAGTQVLNSEGMLEYETQVLNYIRDTGHHVLYRCTPYFVEENLLASGVLIEALSLEDDVISICAYCYNVQPGIVLDYATGANSREEVEPDVSQDVSEESAEAPAESISETTQEEESKEEQTQAYEAPMESFVEESEEPAPEEDSLPEYDYIVNINTGKFHYPGCRSVNQMKEKNKREVHCNRQELIDQGYSPCGNCNP